MRVREASKSSDSLTVHIKLLDEAEASESDLDSVSDYILDEDEGVED